MNPIETLAGSMSADFASLIGSMVRTAPEGLAEAEAASGKQLPLDPGTQLPVDAATQLLGDAGMQAPAAGMQIVADAGTQLPVYAGTHLLTDLEMRFPDDAREQAPETLEARAGGEEHLIDAAAPILVPGLSAPLPSPAADARPAELTADSAGTKGQGGELAGGVHPGFIRPQGAGAVSQGVAPLPQSAAAVPQGVASLPQSAAAVPQSVAAAPQSAAAASAPAIADQAEGSRPIQSPAEARLSAVDPAATAGIAKAEGEQPVIANAQRGTWTADTKGAATLSPAAVPQPLPARGMEAAVPTAALLRAKAAPIGKAEEADTLEDALAARLNRGKSQPGISPAGRRNDVSALGTVGAVAADLSSVTASFAPLPMQNASIGATPLSTVNGPPMAAALDLGAVIDRLVEARQTAAGGRVQLSVNHEDFGAINVRIDQAAGTGLAGVALTSLDPGFAPAVHAALAERGTSERQPASAEPSQRGDQPQPRGDGSAQNGQGQSQHAQAQGNSPRQGAPLGFRDEHGDALAREGRGSAPAPTADDRNLYA